MSHVEDWTIRRLLQWTTDYLAECGSETPRLDGEILLANACGCERIELYTTYDEKAPDSVRDSFRSLVRERARGVPVAYLVGKREFYSLPFRVTPDVLIPRPETEHVVLSVLEKNKEWEGRSLGDLARHRGVRMVDTICDLLIEENLEAAFVARTGAALPTRGSGDATPAAAAPPASPPVFVQVRDALQ